MRKTRLITFSLIIAIVLMGVGYAYWSDNLVICTTTNTGELNVEFIKQCGYPKIYVMDHDGPCNTSEIFAQASISFDENYPKLTTVVISNLYPGTGAGFDVLFKNTGSIPAAFDNAEVIFTSDSDENLKQKMAYSAWYVHYKNDGTTEYKEISTFTPKQDLNNLASDLTHMLDGVILEPGEYVKLDIPEEYKDEAAKIIPGYDPEGDNCIHFWLPCSVDNDDDVEGKTIKFDIMLNFKQHNEI